MCWARSFPHTDTLLISIRCPPGGDACVTSFKQFARQLSTEPFSPALKTCIFAQEAWLACPGEERRDTVGQPRVKAEVPGEGLAPEGQGKELLRACVPGSQKGPRK